MVSPGEKESTRQPPPTTDLVAFITALSTVKSWTNHSSTRSALHSREKILASDLHVQLSRTIDCASRRDMIPVYIGDVLSKILTSPLDDTFMSFRS